VDPRFAWKAGLGLGGAGLLLSLVMMLVATDATAAAPWQIGAVGFGGVVAISAAGLFIGRRR
jgi:hypothetical protein